LYIIKSKTFNSRRLFLKNTLLTISAETTVNALIKYGKSLLNRLLHFIKYFKQK